MFDRDASKASDVDAASGQLRVAEGCEEVAAVLGVSIALGSGLSYPVVRLLARIQNDLYDASAELRARSRSEVPRTTLSERYLGRLERACAHFDDELEPPSDEVLPGGTAPGASLHHARSVVHRVQRDARAARSDLSAHLPGYLALLDTLLLTLARAANAEHGDTDWQPGLSDREDGVELWEPLPEVLAV